MTHELFIGLMSGTSLDGVDAVLLQAESDGRVQALAHHHHPFHAVLRTELLALNAAGDNELQRAALAANAVSRAYAEAVQQVLLAQSLPPRQIRALGAHGQTVRHRPGEFDGTGFTLQLLNAPLLAELTGISVVHDFRSRDLAAGGQGAPLVPAFHRAVFGRDDADVAVLNIGGISNVSLLWALGESGGFDCGPGNCLMDGWIQRHQGADYDADGAWAAQGQVLPGLLQDLLAEPFFHRPPPRSTGRDLFHLQWLDQRLATHPGARPVDVQATLLELSARCVADSLSRFAPGHWQALRVCGGGAFNGRLMQRLQSLLPTVQVTSTAQAGLPPMQVEGAAFAWLAMRWVRHLSGNLPAVTGASGPRVLGSYTPA
ncbi:anhydro-N-acetylmuramic acid kinase [Roseateles depolymerans]|uniref:Anhydro-N-acetylmuramic acid kinase n=1 Tax=Roseateles depolymerans TaxID=76731 RepID=A0A0U3LKM4_9BURK|nr:anhydro-N-acetylmuramic acid kinase [Roseateles depolymerans]ALV05431.1 Anhydro-N-acetylmuramic acid kinase [Roseateles depolymerans]REG14553.1 anhydro-N-acetylmuramic acid kinase [Roseateles depolymerans]